MNTKTTRALGLLVTAALCGWLGWGRLTPFSPASCTENSTTVRYEVPRFSKADVPEQILQRFAYTTSYNSATRTPNWVGWVLTSDHTDGEFTRRGQQFKEDTDVPEPRATYDDIRESECGYQRGHMCPAGDNKWSYKAQEEAFLMTNICPQDGHLNQNDWKYLEEECREWAKRYGAIYIVAGPVFYTSDYRITGEHRVAIPDAFFKVVLAGSEQEQDFKAIGFLYENVAGHHEMEYYVRPVDVIEEITGLDFFYQLDDDTEMRVESTSRLSDWQS